jgi:aryl-alcohol dehydrogenase-like predicted oxidoreductase
MSRERAAALPPEDWRSRNPEVKEPKLSQNLVVVERLHAVGGRHDRSPGEVAIAWTLRQPAVAGAIVGARNAKQVEGVVGGAELRLTATEVGEIEGTTNYIDMTANVPQKFYRVTQIPTNGVASITYSGSF